MTMIMSGFAGAELGAVSLPSPLGADEATAAKSKRSPTNVTIKSIRRHVKVGKAIKVAGWVRPSNNYVGRRKVTVVIKGIGRKTVRTGKHNWYRAWFKTGKTGSFKAFAVAHRKPRAKRARTYPKRVNVYAVRHASYYGPGFYGNRTACGQTLTRGTVGTAHKYLPCGTKVTIRYRGRSVRIPVIDRGPYVAGRDYDLTEAAKAKLRFGSTGSVLATK